MNHAQREAMAEVADSYLAKARDPRNHDCHESDSECYGCQWRHTGLEILDYIGYSTDFEG